MSDGNGVMITIREIYESVNKLSKEVGRLSNRFENLETEIKKQNKESQEAKERSYEAISLANEAYCKAEEADKNAGQALQKVRNIEKEKYEEKISEHEKSKDQRVKFYISIASSLLPWLILIGLGFIYFARTGGF